MGGVWVGVDEGVGSVEDFFWVVWLDCLVGGDGEVLVLVYG